MSKNFSGNFTNSKPIKIAKYEIKKNLKGIVIFSSVVGIFFLFLMLLFDSGLYEGMDVYFEQMPEFMLYMVGGSFDLSTIGGFLNIYVFVFSWMWYGIYLMLRASRDIPDEIENKTIDIILSKPITRTQYIIGKKIQQILMILIIVIIGAGFILLGILISGSGVLNDLSEWSLFLAFLILFLTLIAYESLAFMMSTIFDSKKSMAVSFGIFMLFYFIGTFWKMMPEDIHWIRYFSIFNYIDVADLLMNNDTTNIFLNICVLITYSTTLTITANYIFNKKDIPV